MSNSQKKVFITGATRGIGKAIADKFKKSGFFVIGTCTSRGQRIVRNCDLLIEADFTNDNDINNCAKIIREHKIDILINNAGINKISSFSEIKSETFKRIQKVNSYAPFLLCQAAVGNMENNGWGRIVNISSIWGKKGKEHRASYSASKFALEGISLAISAEYASKGVLVNCISPGFIDTELTREILDSDQLKKLVSLVPQGRLGQPEEIAELVFWLSSEENSFITGQNIAIDGGFTSV